MIIPLTILIVLLTIIYDPTNPEGSALDRILKDKASHYTIVHVDSSIANLQRTFSWDGSTIKGAFDDIANEVECLFMANLSIMMEKSTGQFLFMI